LYCAAGNFYIDPWQPVDRAVITHAHSDHARPGSRSYLCADRGAEILRNRIGLNASIQSIRYGEAIEINGVRVSLHPAGHVLGSAQVRVEHQGEVWVMSGDYKLQTDLTCDAFEIVTCHTFITECTFGLPIYRWRPPGELFDEVNEWWRHNQDRDQASVVYSYALGKAQRILGGIDASIGPIIAHGAVLRFVDAYRNAGIAMPDVLRADVESVKQSRGKALVVAPPSAARTPWLRKFGKQSSATASGWMQVRGNRRRGNVDRGFVISDHVDWDGLLQTIRATGATRICATHGSSEALARYLREQGLDACVYRTRFSDVGEEEAEAELEVSASEGTGTEAAGPSE
jgi:putative mRNA 3-end processing factor